MHIHIVGLCGTFMGGVAQLAVAAGHRVTGCDANVYPPMSNQLKAAGIDLVTGFDSAQLELKPDLWVIGNAISRGNPLLEAILNKGLPYTTGPEWVSKNILQSRHVLAVAGTHGKTTTSSLLTWILEYAGLEPGFLIGGVPENFNVSARLGKGRPFVIEADEYDTCFCDKRSKFVHYRPRTVVLNNLEYDHADIFEDLAAIEKQFHHLVRIIPSEGLVISNARAEALERVLTKGCWSRLERFDTKKGWSITNEGVVSFNEQVCGTLRWSMLGRHNQLNALAAIVAARDVGVAPALALEALAHFGGVKRRLEVKGTRGGVTVMDDFAHHPTAIVETLAALRTKVGKNQRILAVLEPRSNTMKLGTMKARLAEALAEADLVFCYAGVGVEWDIAEALAPLGKKAQTFKNDLPALVSAVVREAKAGDTVLCMSNGGFGGVHGKLLEALEK